MRECVSMWTGWAVEYMNEFYMSCHVCALGISAEVWVMRPQRNRRRRPWNWWANSKRRWRNWESLPGRHIQHQQLWTCALQSSTSWCSASIKSMVQRERWSWVSCEYPKSLWTCYQVITTSSSTPLQACPAPLACIKRKSYPSLTLKKYMCFSRSTFVQNNNSEQESWLISMLKCNSNYIEQPTQTILKWTQTIYTVVRLLLCPKLWFANG